MDSEDPKYTYNRFGSKGKRAGQAVVDILSRDNPSCTVQDVIDGYAPDFLKHFETAVENGSRQYEGEFHIFVLSKKEMWAVNLVRNWFIPRKSAPDSLEMMIWYPHHTKTLYKVNPKIGEVGLQWSVPGLEECKSILKNKDIYAPELVKWIEDCLSSSDSAS
jgi:hypothetical protein